LNAGGREAAVTAVQQRTGEMIISQKSGSLQQRVCLRRVDRACCLRLTRPRIGRQSRAPIVNGVPAQSEGLLFQGGEGGDVAPFSAPVGRC